MNSKSKMEAMMDQRTALAKSIDREVELEKELAEAMESKGRLRGLLYSSMLREQALTTCLEDLLERQDNARRVLNLAKRSTEAILADEALPEPPSWPNQSGQPSF